MKRVLSATEAQVHFGKLLRRVREHDETVMVKKGASLSGSGMSVTGYELLIAKTTAVGWRAQAWSAREERHEQVACLR